MPAYDQLNAIPHATTIVYGLAMLGALSALIMATIIWQTVYRYWYCLGREARLPLHCARCGLKLD